MTRIGWVILVAACGAPPQSQTQPQMEVAQDASPQAQAVTEAQAATAGKRIGRTGNSAASGCERADIRCVGAEYRSIQAAVDAARPGDRIWLNGEYRHPSGTQRSFVQVRRSGTRDAPIVIESAPGRQAHLRGWGFPDDGGLPSTSNERLIDVFGDHIHIRGIEFSGSTRHGLVLGGNYGVAEDVVAHDNWENGILIIGNSGNGITGNRVTRAESYRNRHGSGVLIHVSNSTPRFVADTVIENSLGYRNGWLPDGQKALPVPGDPAGGGNSDGFASSKFCHQMAPELQMQNACPRTLLRNNIAWNNADDGFDHSLGDGSRIERNASLFNGPEGNKGFKGFSPVLGGVEWVHNVAVGNQSTGMELRFGGEGLVANNTAVANGLHGIFVVNGDQRVVVENNVAYDNPGNRDVAWPASAKAANNWHGNASGNPGFVNRRFKVQIAPEGDTVGARYESVRRQIRSLLRLDPNRAADSAANNKPIGSDMLR